MGSSRSRCHKFFQGLFTVDAVNIEIRDGIDLGTSYCDYTADSDYIG